MHHICIWDTATGKRTMYAVWIEKVNCITFTVCGTLLAHAGCNNHLIFRRTSSLQLVTILKGHLHWSRTENSGGTTTSTTLLGCATRQARESTRGGPVCAFGVCVCPLWLFLNKPVALECSACWMLHDRISFKASTLSSA
jgi:hypothetical protein